ILSRMDAKAEASVDDAVPEAPEQSVVLISAGANHSVALLSGQMVCSWGRGEDGQLGHGDSEDRPVPTVLTSFDVPRITSVVCGADHTAAYSDDEMQLYSWGWGDFGRLGHGNSSDVFNPQPVVALQGMKIKQVACGDSHCLAVTVTGQVHSWGRNQNGQLGLGNNEDSLLPQKIKAFEGVCVKMIAAGAEHTTAITEDGHLYGWGWGRYGNLGLSDRDDRSVPEKVSSVEGEKMVLVACGWRHSVTVSSSGGLYTYGWSKYGQLGHGDFEDHLVPRKLEALKDVSISQIAGGWRHTMAVASDGKLYGWGWNKFGQVGVGDDVDHCSPVEVNFPDEQKIAQVACGWRHTLALTENKNVFSWGRGASGQLGHGEIIDRNTPKMIDALSLDGSACKQLESSNAVPMTGLHLHEALLEGLCTCIFSCSVYDMSSYFSAKVWVPPSKRFAIVPEENVSKPGNGTDKH
uniref:RCC1-like domain-containing protein n=3 Tax=Aegilops tauschii subsp. strangulata TaxID=200361 RepID=A0A453NK49_AEGTS